MKFKDLIGNILGFGGFIGIIVCAIKLMVFYFQNPDMTAMRRAIERPELIVSALICYAVLYIGYEIIKK